MFDFFASHRLRRADVTFLHGGFSLPKTVVRAHRFNSFTIDISVSAYFKANAELEREELTKLGFPDFPGFYSRLSNEMTPLAQIDYMILMSEFTKKTYLVAGYPADHLFIAHLDIDTKRFSPQLEKPKNEKFRVLYMAFTQPLKGLHYLLDAWEQLPHLSDAELVISGFFSDMPEELRQNYLKRIESDPRITWLPNTQKPEEYYREASVFVFPSLTEGFGRSTIEAMACGVPVITTVNSQGIVEDGKTGYVLPIRDANAIKEKIEYLYQNPDVAKQMGKDARKAVVEKKPFGEEVHDIYKEIMKRENRV
jgi:glycosyltransferase involved in cell wall biosynthesis